MCETIDTTVVRGPSMILSDVSLQKENSTFKKCVHLSKCQSAKASGDLRILSNFISSDVTTFVFYQSVHLQKCYQSIIEIQENPY